MESRAARRASRHLRRAQELLGFGGPKAKPSQGPIRKREREESEPFAVQFKNKEQWPYNPFWDTSPWYKHGIEERKIQDVKHLIWNEDGSGKEILDATIDPERKHVIKINGHFFYERCICFIFYTRIYN